MKITILGCGTSSGVPMIGCACPVCRSDDPRNRRRRVSILIEADGTRLLIDTPPDLHGQLVDAGVSRIDAVLYTHGHADHVHGIDDLRSINHLMARTLDVYGSSGTLSAIRRRFGYAFEPPGGEWAKPSLNPIAVAGPFTHGGLVIVPFPQEHGRVTTTGYRIDDMAYSTDVKALPEQSFTALRGVRLWIVDCLGYREHPTHAHLALTLEWIARVEPKRAVLTHMSHQFDYETLRGALPAGVVSGHDGLIVDTNELDTL